MTNITPVYILKTILVAFYCIFLTLKGIVLFFVPTRFKIHSVEKKLIVITGAASGIGAALAVRLSKRKARLVLLDMNDSGLKQTKEECNKYQSESCIHTYKIDITDRQQVLELANEIRSTVGSTDILINNAGIVAGKSIMDIDEKTVHKVFDVNVISHFWMVQAFLPDMMKKNSGQIVSIASIAGMFGVNKLSDYCSSKFAAVGFQDSLMNELHYMGMDGIHVLTVCPFYINTGMFDGVSADCPFLPILAKDYAAKKIEEAILMKSHYLFMPKILYFINALKGMVPTSASFALIDFMKANSSMDTFKGRKSD